MARTMSANGTPGGKDDPKPDANPRAVIGGNFPPPDRAAYDALKAAADDLMVEVGNWCDGVKIETQEQADVVARLIDQTRKLRTAADDARKKEAKPWDDGKAEIQDRYNKLIGETKAIKGALVRAQEALQATLTPWLVQLQQAQAAEAARLRKIADDEAAAARAALLAANPANIVERQAAEEQVQAAAGVVKEAARAEKARPIASAGEGARGVGLRTTFVPVLENGKEALAHYMVARKEELRAWLTAMAEIDVREGKRSIPGFRIDTDRKAV